MQHFDPKCKFKFNLTVQVLTIENGVGSLHIQTETDSK